MEICCHETSLKHHVYKLAFVAMYQLQLTMVLLYMRPHVYFLNMLKYPGLQSGLVFIQRWLLYIIQRNPQN